MVFMGNSESAQAQVESGDESIGVRFELQAIASAVDLTVYGYEFLYRGKVRPTSAAGWANIDEGVLRYLGEVSLGLNKVCFVNLSHESVLSVPERAFKAATRQNDLRFEMSEAVTECALFERVCDKVNRLTSRGIHFAIDDFGAGLDGSRRLYALDRVAVIKVDRGLLVTAAGRAPASQMLAASVSSWKAAGIQTVAEGVETPELLEFARRLGSTSCRAGMSTRLSRPNKPILAALFFDQDCSVLWT